MEKNKIEIRVCVCTNEISVPSTFYVKNIMRYTRGGGGGSLTPVASALQRDIG